MGYYTTYSLEIIEGKARVVYDVYDESLLE